MVEKILKKCGPKIWILLTCRAYKIVCVFQIILSHSIIFLLNTFYGTIVYYFSIFLLTLQIVNSL